MVPFQSRLETLTSQKFTSTQTERKLRTNYRSLVEKGSHGALSFLIMSYFMAHINQKRLVLMCVSHVHATQHGRLPILDVLIDCQIIMYCQFYRFIFSSSWLLFDLYSGLMLPLLHRRNVNVGFLSSVTFIGFVQSMYGYVCAMFFCM